MFKKKLTLIYEIIMFTLAIISVSFIWVENESFKSIDTAVWILFVIDVSVRFLMADNKTEYIKKNPFDIIAIIPLDSIFRLARLVRLVRIIRALTIAKRYAGPFYEILKTNGLQKVLTFAVILLFTAAIPILYIEPSIHTYEDALWWSIVTATTVGYGDISVETGLGRIIAIILMLFGIGILGMVTGTIATYFIKEEKNEDQTITFLKHQLDTIDKLTNHDIQTMIILIERYKKTTG